MPPNPSPTASTLEVLTYIHAKLEALQKEIESARASGVPGAALDPQASEVRVLGEIARRLMPRGEENNDPEFMHLMRKQADIANLLVAVKARLAS